MTKLKSTTAICAATIKKELKGHFPDIKFFIKSDTFSMGDSVNIDWTDGPSLKTVKEIVDKYQYGHFNGMEDMYHDSNKRNDIPQVKYISVSKKVSRAHYEKALAIYKDKYLHRVDHEAHKEIVARTEIIDNPRYIESPRYASDWIYSESLRNISHHHPQKWVDIFIAGLATEIQEEELEYPELIKEAA